MHLCRWGSQPSRRTGTAETGPALTQLPVSEAQEQIVTCVCAWAHSHTHTDQAVPCATQKIKALLGDVCGSDWKREVSTSELF